MVNKSTCNGKDVTSITSGVRLDDFRNDFQNIFLSRLCSPSIAFFLLQKTNLPTFSMVCTLNSTIEMSL